MIWPNPRVRYTEVINREDEETKALSRQMRTNKEIIATPKITSVIQQWVEDSVYEYPQVCRGGKKQLSSSSVVPGSKYLLVRKYAENELFRSCIEKSKQTSFTNWVNKTCTKNIVALPLSSV
jgi:hypothetical protein